MVHISGVSDFVMWAGFILLVFIFLLLDLGLFNRKKHAITIKQALIWTGIWISLSLLFNLFVLLQFGHDAALKFLGGYLLEKSLSVDNIFVMFLIFSSFKIAPKYQHRVLFWGIIGALVMRGLLIGLGSALVERFAWILYLFGAFLVYTGISMFFKKDEDFDPHDGWIVRLVHKIIPVSKDHKDGRFFVKHKGKIAVTIMFVTLLVIEVTDVAFAFDSIPAIFGITTDAFLVFTSNIFAILGLRSLYFVVERLHGMFKYLSYGLAFILVFIGAKMLVAGFFEISLALSLGIVFAVLLVSILASIFLGDKSPST